MRKKTLFILVSSIIISLIIFLTTIFIYYKTNSGPTKPILLSGKECYLENTYLKVDNNYYFTTAKDTLDRIKPINDENLNNFYMFYGYLPYRQSEEKSISLILEYKYEDMSRYEAKRTYLSSNFEYYDKLNFKSTNFTICIINNNEITKFRNTKEIPYAYGAICYNDADLIIRYVSFIDYKTSYDLSGLFECSNCDW